LPIYIDESGGLYAGAMTMAAVEIDADNAEKLLRRFRAVTGLRGELKGSRIDLVQRALFFELLERFHGRARICVAQSALLGSGADRPTDFEAYVALMKQLVEDWLPETGGCASFVVDEGRYSALVLEQVRLDIAAMLASFGTARMEDSSRCPGIQIADVIANSYYNLAIQSGRSHRIAAIVEPFVQAHILRSRPLPHFNPAPITPVMLDAAVLAKADPGLPLRSN
jgi:hypothetical protein